MRTLLSYLLTPIFYLAFGLILVVFDPLQRITLKLFGHRAHDTIISVITGSLTNSTRILGATYKVEGREHLPDDRPLIFTANHQSMYDIPPIFWFFRKYHPKFVVKQELARGIPTISYNIRNGGSVTIDRKNPKQAIHQIQKLGQFINKKKFAAVIYPEGTRSRSGSMKPFKTAGVSALLDAAPDALLVPLTINRAYQFTSKGLFPLQVGVRMEYIVHEPIENTGDTNAIIAKAEAAVRSALKE
jgi:1-acyl-sn-glycerol-3-phosphate acyltransferase